MDTDKRSHVITIGRMRPSILAAILSIILITVAGTAAAQKYVLVAPGSFTMGSNVKDTEQPAHEVTITQPFQICDYEVTQKEWFDIMETEPWLDGEGTPLEFVQIGNNIPATHVSWNDVQEFINLKNNANDGYEYRLPTEAEWEYACRAGSDKKFYFGDEAGDLGDYAWYRENTVKLDEPWAHQVGQKLPNTWEIFDMHGNVWEWCRDWYAPYTAEDQIDPTGPEEGTGGRVIRGSSFENVAEHNIAYDCRSATRLSRSPIVADSFTGFRLVRILLDADGDGVDDSDEDYPNDARKASLPAASGNGKIIFDVSSTDGASLRDITVMSATDDENLNLSGLPSGTVFPHGLVSFRIVGLAAGQTATITLTFPETLPGDVAYYKVDDAGFYKFTAVSFNGKRATLTITDGEEGDMDDADGVILDPGGPADPPAPPEGGGDGGGGGGGCFIGGMLE